MNKVEIALFFLLLISSCNTEGTSTESTDSAKLNERDSVALTPNYLQFDTTFNKSLVDEIDSAVAAEKYSKKAMDLMDMSSEGGELTAYLDGKSVRKISVTLYGSIGKVMKEYYYYPTLIFLREINYTYDRPMSDGNVGIAKSTTAYFYFDNTDRLALSRPSYDTMSYEQIANKQEEILKESSQLLNIVSK